MDNVNFTGIKNLGACISVLPQSSKKNITRSNILLELTDDKYGNDLTEFRRLYKECMPEAGIRLLPNSKIINIMTSVADRGHTVPEMSINFSKIPAMDKTLSLFTFVAKLTRQILKIPDGTIINNRDQNLIAMNNYLVPGVQLQSLAKNANDYMQNFANFCHPENIKMTAEQINKQIQAQMMDYLA